MADDEAHVVLHAIRSPAAMATIVLAEDDDDLRNVYATCLRSAGHVVWEARDGRRALEEVRLRKPDLLLLDIWMPQLNGFEVLAVLRHDAAGGRLKVIVLSSLADNEHRLRAFEAGAAEYLTKGRPLAELLHTVEGSLSTPIVSPFQD